MGINPTKYYITARKREKYERDRRKILVVLDTAYFHVFEASTHRLFLK